MTTEPPPYGPPPQYAPPPQYGQPPQYTPPAQYAPPPAWTPGPSTDQNAPPPGGSGWGPPPPRRRGVRGGVVAVVLAGAVVVVAGVVVLTFVLVGGSGARGTSSAAGAASASSSPSLQPFGALPLPTEAVWNPRIPTPLPLDQKTPDSFFLRHCDDGEGGHGDVGSGDSCAADDAEWVSPEVDEAMYDHYLDQLEALGYRLTHRGESGSARAIDAVGVNTEVLVIADFAKQKISVQVLYYDGLDPSSSPS